MNIDRIENLIGKSTDINLIKRPMQFQRRPAFTQSHKRRSNNEKNVTIHGCCDPQQAESGHVGLLATLNTRGLDGFPCVSGACKHIIFVASTFGGRVSGDIACAATFEVKVESNIARRIVGAIA